MIDYMAKRLISTGIGIIILILVMISNNIYVFNLALTIISLLGIYEFYNAFKSKGVKVMPIIGYIACLGILFLCKDFSFYKTDTIKNILILSIPILILILFIRLVVTNMKTNIQDAAITFLRSNIYTIFFNVFNYYKAIRIW